MEKSIIRLLRAHIFLISQRPRIRAVPNLRHTLRAIAAGEFEFKREPVINIRTQEVLYEELLLRVNRCCPVLSVAELLHGVGHHRFFIPLNTLLTMEALLREGNKGDAIGVNMSPLILDSQWHKKLLNTFLKHFNKKQGNCSKIYIELLESPPYKPTGDIIRWCRGHSSYFLHIGLDDFGARKGCHTLEHMKELSATFLKIDGEKVGKLLAGAAPSANLAAALAYCREKKLPIVAEHAATWRDADTLLRKFGVTHVQSRTLS